MNTLCYLCGSEKLTDIIQQSFGEASSQLNYQVAQADLEKPKKLLKCSSCGLIFSEKEFSDQDYLHAYEVAEDLAYLAEEAGRRKAAKKVLKRIGKLKRPGRLLEIGCFAGFFLDEARKSRWKVTGVEPSRWAANYAKSHFNLNVLEGTLENVSLPEQKFDAIVLLDVIEHLTDPKALLAKARKLLNHRGILYISTPNIASLPPRFLKTKWWGINRFHLFYFSKKSLTRLLELEGFFVAKTQTHPRYFSLAYLRDRLAGWNKSISKVFSIFPQWLLKKTIKLNLFDQLDVIAKKQCTLSDFDDEKVSQPVLKPLEKKKVVVVLPAYNAEKTLPITFRDIPKASVDQVILVDDNSSDNTVSVAELLGMQVIRHDSNRGYGANQKTCYQAALDAGADIVVMVHPDYQYDPKVIPKLIAPIQRGEADAVFGSRMMKGGALEGGMPKWKYKANILLTALENVVLGIYLTEYHTGFRAYSAELLRSINLEANSDSFVFDTEIIVQAILQGFKIEEEPIRTRYFEEASKIKFWPSFKYGMKILWVLFKYLLHTKTWVKFKQF